MRLNSFATLLFIIVMTLAGCGGGGGGTAGTVTPDENVTETNTSILPLIIIRIEFNDYQFSSPASTWSQKIFGTIEGQLNHYFNEISYSKFQFQAAYETDGVNDGIITVHLDEDHPGDIQRFVTRLVTAATIAKDFINYFTYDTDNDGSIQADELQIMFLVAGGESATGAIPGIWAHSWCLYGQYGATAPTLDNVKLMSCNDNGVYSAFGEKHFNAVSGNDATIGVIAHELGHAVFALPDLYNTDPSASSSGIGNFGLMGGGSWAYKEGDDYVGATPVHMTGWSKVYSKFTTSTVIDSNISDLDINATSRKGYNLYQVSTGLTGEYFLLENRAASGYDRGLFSLQGEGSFQGGLSILHIDNNLLTTCISSNTCNNDAQHKLVDVEEANNDPELDINSTYEGHYDNLFYSPNNESFTPVTLPNTKRYDGEDSGVSILNISNPDATMNIDIEIN